MPFEWGYPGVEGGVDLKSAGRTLFLVFVPQIILFLQGVGRVFSSGVGQGWRLEGCPLMSSLSYCSQVRKYLIKLLR